MANPDKKRKVDIKKHTLARMVVPQGKYIIQTMVIQKDTQTRMNILFAGMTMVIQYLKEKNEDKIMTKYDNNFYDERDLIDCLNRGCEVEFLYNEKKYSITHIDEGICIIEYGNLDSEKIYKDARHAMEHKIEEKQLKDIIQDMKIIDRSF